MIQIIYEQLYGEILEKDNLAELAATLAEIAGRDEPWSWRYLNGIIKQHKNVSASKDMIRAAEILGARLDGQSDLQARARHVSLFSTNGTVEGSFIIGLHTKRCSYCQLPFLGHPSRKYCCDEHGRAYRRDQREQ